MDFARKQLEKYGWSDGKGLGKHGDGISEPLKPKLKRSAAGLGHDAAADFTEHWWNTLYDKAAGNIQVEEKNGKTKKIKAKEDFEITNSTWKLKRKKKKKTSEPTEEEYTNFFVKKAILTSGGSKTERVNEKESDDDDDEEVIEKDVLKMTDEELFAACGGRTAHKGARHGLKALGKLARIEEQEKLLLREDKFDGYSHKKKLKSDKNVDSVKDDGTNNCDADIKNVKCKKNKNIIDDDASLEDVEDQKSKRNKKKKKRHCKDIDQSFVNGDIITSAINEVQIEEINSENHKTKRKSDEFVNDSGDNVIEKKKKKKRKDL